MQKMLVQLKLFNQMPSHIKTSSSSKFKYFISKLTQLYNEQKLANKPQGIFLNTSERQDPESKME